MTRLFSASTRGLYESGDKNVPEDAIEISDDLYLSLMGQQIHVGSDGKPELYDSNKDPAVLRARFEQAIQNQLDNAARARGYDTISNAVSYAEEPAVAKFQEDGKAFRAWRSLVWAYAYQELAKVEAGKRKVPEVSDFLGELPKLEI